MKKGLNIVGNYRIIDMLGMTSECEDTTIAIGGVIQDDNDKKYCIDKLGLEVLALNLGLGINEQRKSIIVATQDNSEVFEMAEENLLEKTAKLDNCIKLVKHYAETNDLEYYNQDDIRELTSKVKIDSDEFDF